MNILYGCMLWEHLSGEAYSLKRVFWTCHRLTVWRFPSSKYSRGIHRAVIKCPSGGYFGCPHAGSLGMSLRRIFWRLLYVECYGNTPRAGDLGTPPGGYQEMSVRRAPWGCRLGRCPTQAILLGLVCWRCPAAGSLETPRSRVPWRCPKQVL